jgi:hypothetical protein
MIASAFCKTFFALRLMSSRLPMGVDIMYRPLLRLFILFVLTIIISCAPQNYPKKNKVIVPNIVNDDEIETNDGNSIDTIYKNTIPQYLESLNFAERKILNEVELLLPEIDNQNITRNFINAFELSIYKKNAKNVQLNINTYKDKTELDNIILQKASPGKMFIGPLTSTDSENIFTECSKGVLFFSFASDRKQAGKCVYLINFFPEDDLLTLFNNFKTDSKIALLYPENNYGYYINSIIDPFAIKSNSIIINRASYKEDLSNARDAIKELGKYELRKYELERQKTILKAKNDEESKKALKKIKRFETIGALDFSHLILPDYSLRLLQIAPLLPFYDIDPQKVQFVGTGVWDNKVFFSEPSLQGSIFPGIPQSKRKQYFDDYYLKYREQPTRTITIPYDLIGILEYIIDKKLNLKETHQLLNDKFISFDGIDGKFSFKKNIISRKLNILKISNGKANLIK